MPSSGLLVLVLVLWGGLVDWQCQKLGWIVDVVGGGVVMMMMPCYATIEHVCGAWENGKKFGVARSVRFNFFTSGQAARMGGESGLGSYISLCAGWGCEWAS